MNQQQIDRYLERIGFDGPINHDGDTLDRLIWAHISTVPFESLDLHEYGIVPSLNIDDLYEKFVVKRRGGYCFEQNTIFGQLLNDLGFPTYATVVRLLGPPGFPLFPYSHKGLVSEAEGKSWYCDVGYGGPGPKGAVEIRDGEQIVGGLTYRGTIRPNDFFIERKTDDGWANVLYFAQRPIESCDFASRRSRSHPLFHSEQRGGHGGHFRLYDCPVARRSEGAYRHSREAPRGVRHRHAHPPLEEILRGDAPLFTRRKGSTSCLRNSPIATSITAAGSNA